MIFYSTRLYGKLPSISNKILRNEFYSFDTCEVTGPDKKIPFTPLRKDLKVRPSSLWLWDFLLHLLNDTTGRYIQYVQWKNIEEGIFKIVDPPGLAALWGKHKNIPNMNYDKMSRSLRNYYKSNKMKKVSGQRQCFQFIYHTNPAPFNVSQSHFMSNLGVMKKSLDVLTAQAQNVKIGPPPLPTEAVFTKEFVGIKQEEFDIPEAQQ